MAKLKVIGVCERKGKFNDIPWRNLMLHCTTTEKGCIGSTTEIIKIKWSKLDDVLGLELAPNESVDNFVIGDFKNLIGKEIRAFYDKFRNVEEVEIYDNDETETTSSGNKPATK